MALDRLRTPRDAVRVEPALRPELARVGAPERGGRVHVPDRHGHLLALADGDVVDELAGECADGFGERDDVVLRSLGRWTVI